MRLLLLTILMMSACGRGAGTGTGDCQASITSMGANATHDHYSGGATLGDWSTSAPQMGVLTAVCANFDQALSIVLSGAVPTQGATYSLTGSGSDGYVKYGDSGQATRVWSSVAGTATINSITPSTTDHSKTLRISFANVSAQPASVANPNTATGNLTLQGSALIEGVYLPAF